MLKKDLWNLIAFLVAVLSFVKYAKGDSDVTMDLICPDSDPANCYPAVFQPTEEWQTVRDGQAIPAGLEVRMAMDGTGIREARLDNAGGVENGVADGAEQAVMIHKEEPQEPKDIAVMAGGRSEVVDDSDSEKKQFVESLDYVISSWVASRDYDHAPPTQNLDELVRRLEFLSEAGSDIKFGVDIIEHWQPFVAFAGLGNKEIGGGWESGEKATKVAATKEVSTRALAASLRNNEGALQLFASYFKDRVQFLDGLVKQEGITDNMPLLLRRRLGLLDALIMSDEFESAYHAGEIEAKLGELYKAVTDRNVRQRINNVIEDVASKQQTRGDERVVNSGDHGDEL